MAIRRGPESEIQGLEAGELPDLGRQPPKPHAVMEIQGLEASKLPDLGRQRSKCARSLEAGKLVVQRSHCGRSRDQVFTGPSHAAAHNVRSRKCHHNPHTRAPHPIKTWGCRATPYQNLGLKQDYRSSMRGPRKLH